MGKEAAFLAVNQGPSPYWLFWSAARPASWLAITLDDGGTRQAISQVLPRSGAFPSQFDTLRALR